MATERGTFGIGGLVVRNARHYWRTNAAVVLGCAIAVAALVGSLLVGGSVRGSLRDVALERLGPVQYALSAPWYFRQQLAADVGAQPAILLSGTAKPAAGGAVVPGVSVIGVTDPFWSGQDVRPPHERDIVLNATLARDLGVATGDAVLLTVGRRASAPVDSLFARRTSGETTHVLRLVVAGVIPARGIGIFSLRQVQAPPRNLYVSLDWLQAQLHEPAMANTLLAKRDPGAALAASVKLEDYGLKLIPDPAADGVALESDRLLLTPAEVAHAQKAAPGCRLRSVYLANALTLGDREVPYSVVASPPAEGAGWPALGPDDMLLNQWTADQLGAHAGDTIAMAYYAADERGNLTTKARTFTLRGIVPMEGVAIDRALVPDFEGITDATTMANWDPPFPMDLGKIRPADEDYWNQYRTAPKAFLSLDTVRAFWQGGGVTGVAVKGHADRFSAAFLKGAPADLGLAFRPVRQEALAAAHGSTDFGVLFVSMSFFIVAAAAGMVGLLLRLSIERRAGDFGIMTATGFTARRAARVLVGEGLLLGAFGAVLGAAFGVGYAWLIVLALRTWWSGAVGDFRLVLHVGAGTVAGGAVAGFCVSALAAWWAARLLRRTPTLTLLAGWRALGTRPSGRARRRALVIGIGSLAVAVVLLALGVAKAMSEEGAFFGGGSLLLIGLLSLACAGFMRRAGAGRTVSLWRLGWRGASRNWTRSLLTAGLLACASFVVVTVAANRVDLSRLDTSRRSSGAGGFSLLARSDIGLRADLNTAAGREALGLPETLAAVKFYPFHMSSGDDASCLNIQRPVQPRVLGVPHELVERGGFTFTALSEKTQDPWSLLERDADGAVPAFADATSAEWVLHVGLGHELTVAGAGGKPVRLRIVGLLASSVFASELLISDAQYRAHFGSDAGWRYYLIETPPGAQAAVARALREGLGALGFDVRRTADVMAGYARVQNTYLATFQTLGGLGLLLGTFGMVTVLLRSVVERRSELAMLLALGLRRTQVTAIILIEHGALLLLGLAIGSAAALVAVVPHVLSSLADVNWLSLGGLLAACTAVGLLSCAVAATASVRGELLPALRSE